MIKKKTGVQVWEQKMTVILCGGNLWAWNTERPLSETKPWKVDLPDLGVTLRLFSAISNIESIISIATNKQIILSEQNILDCYHMNNNTDNCQINNNNVVLMIIVHSNNNNNNNK